MSTHVRACLCVHASMCMRVCECMHYEHACACMSVCVYACVHARFYQTKK